MTELPEDFIAAPLANAMHTVAERAHQAGMCADEFSRKLISELLTLASQLTACNGCDRETFLAAAALAFDLTERKPC